ncbi:MAG: NAD-dependent epimerase/dehydratase family protein [Deltaproteobacteria bacterium]|nr:NAD-dependent epimerase/dehydratase family protein [Deltaproteobacteria bacterium]MBI4224217.1 NAD-dependent epimerase/dehydratase family protein [Deltaproteobacteria bacterium]
MQALVTGGSGFIGANLVRALLKKGVGVRVLVRKTSSRKALTGLDIEFYEGDLRDCASLGRAFQGCDLLFHTAAHYDFWAPDRRIFYDVNVGGTENILKAARRAGIPKIVYTSTVGTLRCPENQGKPSDETCCATEAEMENDYKRSKFLAEQLVLRYAREGLPVVIVNPSAPIGAFDVRPTPTGKIILDFLQGKIPAYVDTGLNIIDVEDVAEGHWLAAQKGKTGERYILGNKNISLRAIYEAVAKLNCRAAPRLCIPYGLAWVMALGSEVASRFQKKRPKISLGAVKMARRHMYFDASKAVRELDLPQSPVEKAFAKAVGWFQSNGYLQPT